MAVGSLVITQEIRDQLDMLDARLDVIGDVYAAKLEGWFDALDFGTIEENALSTTGYSLSLYGPGHTLQGSAILGGTGFDPSNWDGNPATETAGAITVNTVVKQVDFTDAAGNTLLSYTGSVSGFGTIYNVFGATSVQVGDADLGAYVSATGNLNIDQSEWVTMVEGTLSQLVFYVRHDDRAFRTTFSGDLSIAGAQFQSLLFGTTDSDNLTLTGRVDSIEVARLRYADASSTAVVGTDTILDLAPLNFSGTKLHTWLDNAGDALFSAGALVWNGDDVLTADVAGGVSLRGYGGNDKLTGGAAADDLWGGGSAPYFSTNDGRDILDGKGGVDTMRGGSGSDTYFVDLAGDLVLEAANNGTDTVKSSAASYTLANNVEHLILLGNSGIHATGNSGNNSMVGNRGGNSLVGGGGFDILEGRAGNDTLDGGASFDRLSGGLGNDTYVFDASLPDFMEEEADGGIDTVLANNNFVLTAHFERLTLTAATGNHFGTGNFLANTITGNGGANLLRGLEGADLLVGGDGADTLSGGFHADTLNGGAGADKFYFDTPLVGGNVDLITSFSASEDMVLDDDVFTQVGAPGVLASTRFALGTEATAASHRIIYDQASGALFYDPDGTGAAPQVQFALVGQTTHPVLARGNFEIVS